MSQRYGRFSLHLAVAFGTLADIGQVYKVTIILST